jgi:hypothetical protein
MRERSELGAGSASVPRDRASAQLEDGSNGLDSVLDLLLDAMGRIGPWPAIEAAPRLTASLVYALDDPVPPELVGVKVTNFLRQRATASDSPRTDLHHDHVAWRKRSVFSFGEYGPWCVDDR